MQSLEMKSSAFTGCKSGSCWIGYWDWPLRLTYGAPGSPFTGPTLAPGHSSTQRRAAVISPDKRGERTVLAPHESNQAHGEHIRTSGFYLPFLLMSLQRVDWGVKFVRCHMTTSHTAFEIPRASSMHSPDSCCPFSYSPFATEALRWRAISGRNQPASVQPNCTLKETFTRECSLTSTRVIEAERTPLQIDSQDGNSSVAADPKLLFHKGERGKISVMQRSEKRSDDRSQESLQKNRVVHSVLPCQCDFGPAAS